MLPIIVYSALTLFVVLVIYILTRPSTFAVTRSQSIAAPASDVMTHVADFHAWLAWSPWEGLDSSSIRTFGDIPSGVGASYHWAGNAKVGEGRMTITDLTADKYLGIDIEFIRPFTVKNRVTFDFVSSASGTTVTWTMSGANSFLGKVMSLVINCEKMIGGPFEKGLLQLKKVCETAGR